MVVVKGDRHESIEGVVLRNDQGNGRTGGMRFNSGQVGILQGALASTIDSLEVTLSIKGPPSRAVIRGCAMAIGFRIQHLRTRLGCE